jgi:hypothetical protein
MEHTTSGWVARQLQQIGEPKAESASSLHSPQWEIVFVDQFFQFSAQR